MIDIDKFTKRKNQCNLCEFYKKEECTLIFKKEKITCLYDYIFDIVVDFQKEFCQEIHKQICTGISLSELDKKLTDIIDF